MTGRHRASPAAGCRRAATTNNFGQSDDDCQRVASRGDRLARPSRRLVAGPAARVAADEPAARRPDRAADCLGERHLVDLRESADSRSVWNPYGIASGDCDAFPQPSSRICLAAGVVRRGRAHFVRLDISTLLEGELVD